MRICVLLIVFFFFNDTATTEIYTLSLHDALPIFVTEEGRIRMAYPETTFTYRPPQASWLRVVFRKGKRRPRPARSEEHTSELQSRQYLVCRLLLEKKKKNKSYSCMISLYKTSIL